MNNNRGVFTKIYFGVPRFIGEWFRATKIPSLLLLLGFLGVPLLSGLYTVTYARLYHSTYPIDLFFGGAIQFKIEHDPTAAQNPPPQVTALMQKLTREQKQWGKLIYECYLGLFFVLVGAILWWIIATIRFYAKKATTQTP